MSAVDTAIAEYLGVAPPTSASSDITAPSVRLRGRLLANKPTPRLKNVRHDSFSGVSLPRKGDGPWLTERGITRYHQLNGTCGITSLIPPVKYHQLVIPPVKYPMIPHAVFYWWYY